MQAGPAKPTELFARLADISDNAVKTREDAHLFPILRKQPETKELVAAAIRDNKELRAKLGELDALPKSDETFLGKVAELQKAFRRHARDEKRELLPAGRLGSVCAEQGKYHSGIAACPHPISGNTATDPLRGICGTLARAPEPAIPTSLAAMPHHAVATSPIALSVPRVSSIGLQ